MRSNAVLAIDDFEEESQIEVRDNDGFKGVFAQEAIMQDSVIFYLKGAITTQPTKYTIQLGHRQAPQLPSY